MSSIVSKSSFSLNYTLFESGMKTQTHFVANIAIHSLNCTIFEGEIKTSMSLLVLWLWICLHCTIFESGIKTRLGNRSISANHVCIALYLKVR